MSGMAPLETFDLSLFAQRIVEAGILNARSDPSEMKERIMLARQCGFLTDGQTEDWIAVAGLKHA